MTLTAIMGPPGLNSNTLGRERKERRRNTRVNDIITIYLSQHHNFE
jgi:hypothetical protein